jgi:hypothetical protein
VRDWVGETEAFLDDSGQIRKLLELGQGRKVIWVWDCSFELVEEFLTYRRVGRNVICNSAENSRSILLSGLAIAYKCDSLY